MPYSLDSTGGTLFLLAAGILALAACTDSPSLPLEELGGPQKGMAAPTSSTTTCMGGYVSDGNGGCIYAPESPSGGYTYPIPPSDDPGTKGGGTEPEDDPPCNTGYAVLDDPQVQAAFATLWGKSGFSQPQSQRREQGGWVIKNPDGTFSVQEFPLEWGRTPCEIAIPPDAWPPLGTIAIIHTHPFRRGELLTTCERQQLPNGTFLPTNYRHDSSTDDDALIRSFRTRGADLIGIIIDNEKIVVYGGTGNPPLLLGRCGY